jgi:FkbM family methyltransferase
VRSQLRRLGIEVSRWPPRKSDDVLFAKRVRELEIDTVLDVGAHEGEWALGLRRLGFAGRIISYEPGSAAYGRLQAAAAEDPMWEARHVAVGRQRGTASLQVRRNTMMSSLRSVVSVPESHRGQAGVAKTETVEVIALDDEWPGGRVLLKIDTQGSDLEVITGCRDRMTDVALLQIELAVRPTYEGQPDYITALAHVRALGFEPVALTPIWWDDDGRILEADCVLIRKDG